MQSVRASKILALFATFILAAAANAQSKSCRPAGGMLMTNLGAVDAATTMGTATGDLRGAVGATILSTESSGDTLILHVQHHWVTESGDTLDWSPASATTTQVAPGLYAIVSYPTHLKGGTGRFAGATGDFTAIGEANLGNGQIVLRYSGKLCFASGD
jgi:hypothetical protein